MGSAFKSSRKLNISGSKASNAGFSLVELLIAVVILAIIVIPLLRMFVTSTRINVKSRQMLRATTVAQDIMEGLKAYTLEEVRTQFTPPDGTSGNSYFFPTEGFYVVNTSMIQGGVREIEELGPDVSGEEVYYFGIENLKMQGGEYDALIKLDASTYGAKSIEGSATSGLTPDSSSHDNEFNGAFYAEISSVEETNGGSGTDSSYHEPKELNKAVLADVKEQIKDAIGEDNLPDDWDDKTLEDFLTKREIEVVIEDANETDGDGNGKCKATITFTYTCQYDGMTFTCNGKDGTSAGLVDGITRTFSSGNFYLFYYPCYASTQIDNIIFIFEDSAKLFDADNPMLKSITLAKQIRSDVIAADGIIAPELTDNELFSKEGAYVASVRMKMGTSSSSMNNNLIFRTNIDTNLAEMAKHTDPETGEIERDDVIGINPAFEGVLGSKVQQIGLTGTNVSDKITNVIYDIEITVYETGAAEHFGEAHFENNHEVHRLASITNLDR